MHWNQNLITIIIKYNGYRITSDFRFYDWFGFNY